MSKSIKKSNVRHWFQAAWFALTNGYVRGYTNGKIYTGNTKKLCVPGLNCYSCPGALGACPIGALQTILGNGSYRISLYVFGLLSLFGVLFGRLVCGWMCPFGLVQDLLYKIKVKGKKKNLPGHKYLKYLRYLILIVFVVLLTEFVGVVAGVGHPWFCEWICPSGTLLGGIPLVTLNPELREVIGFRFAWKCSLLVIYLVASVWFYRPFCKYFCPLGAIYGLFNSVSTYRLEIDSEKCVKCGACQRACGMDIKTFETPNCTDCIRCGECMRACPKGAISSSWGNTALKIKSRCLIDDTSDPKSDNATALPGNPFKGYTVYMAVLMIVGGIFGIIYGSTNAFMKDLTTRFMSGQSGNMMLPILILGIMELLAFSIVLVTGIRLICVRNEAVKERTVAESIKIACFAYLLGVFVFLISAIVFFNNATVMIDEMIVHLSNFFFPLPALLCLYLMARMLEDRRGHRKQIVFFWILPSAVFLAVFAIHVGTLIR